MDRITGVYILTKRLIIMTAVGIAVFTALFSVTLMHEEGRLMVSWAVFVCGILGGFVSIQQRVKTVSNEELQLLTRSWFQILLIPIFGGLFALVLYSMFLSGIVSGHMFPAFYIPEPQGAPDREFIVQFLTETYPATGQDMAKLLFWSFVAGFSERFVPQIITRVSESVNEDESGEKEKGKSSAQSEEQPEERSGNADAKKEDSAGK